MLTKEQLYDLNNRMLDLGAPIERDFSGYNACDFHRMYFYSRLTPDYFTDGIISDISNTLVKYTKTQLPAYREEIIITAEAYREKSGEAVSGKIIVNNCSAYGITASLPKYAPEISSFIKENDECEYVGKNIIRFAWKITGRVSKILLDDGFDVSSILQAFSDMKTGKFENQKEPLTEIQVHGINPEVIKISFPYKKEITDYIKANRDKCRWEKGKKDWLLCIALPFFDEAAAVFAENNFNVDPMNAEVQKLLKKLENEPLKVVFHSEKAKGINIGNVVVEATGPAATLVQAIPSYAKEGRRMTINTADIPVLYEELKKQNKDFDEESFKPYLKIWKNKAVKPKKIPHEPYRPYEFQLKDVSDMLEKKCCILGNEMGCGKTHESVRVGYSLKMKKLIICPASLRLNWKNEVLMADPQADVGIIQSADKKIESHEWLIIGYPSVAKHLTKLKKMGIRCIFADEAHFIKAVDNYGTPTSQRGAAVLELAAYAEYVYAITGTPKTSRNKDLYNILRMIRHPLVVKNGSFYDYGQRYCDAYNNGYGMDYSGNSNDEELNRQIEPYMIRHLKKDVLPNLKKQRQIITVDANTREYKKLLKEAMTEFRNSGNKKTAAFLGMLQKAKQNLAIAKISSTLDLSESITSAGDQIVIVSCFTEVINQIEQKYKDNCCKIVGGMSDTEKQQAVDDFQSGRKQVIAVNVVAGGVGITLTAASKMIINDVPWTTGELVQVEDRICRSGQTKECLIYYILADGIPTEKKLVGTLTAKSKTINTAVDGGRGEEIDFISLILNSKNA